MAFIKVATPRQLASSPPSVGTPSFRRPRTKHSFTHSTHSLAKSVSPKAAFHPQRRLPGPRIFRSRRCHHRHQRQPLHRHHHLLHRHRHLPWQRNPRHLLNHRHRNKSHRRRQHQRQSRQQHLLRLPQLRPNKSRSRWQRRLKSRRRQNSNNRRNNSRASSSIKLPHPFVRRQQALEQERNNSQA